MVIGDLRCYWMHYRIFYENGGSDNLVNILECCMGEHKDGLIFKGKGKYGGQVFVLKCDEDDCCYKRSADLEEKMSAGFLGILEACDS